MSGIRKGNKKPKTPNSSKGFLNKWSGLSVVLTTVISGAMLISSVTFMVFKTDVVTAINDDQLFAPKREVSTTVSTVIEQVKKDEEEGGTQPGEPTVVPPLEPGETPPTNPVAPATPATQELRDVLSKLAGESSSEEGYLWVLCTAVARAGGSMDPNALLAAMSAKGAYAGLRPGNTYLNLNPGQAKAVERLIAGERPTTCRYFFGRVNGHDIWAEPGAGVVANRGGNVFYTTYGKVHNAKGATAPAGSFVIYDHTQKIWCLPDGQSASI